MTRIVAGEAGGRRLQTPRGERTRPTSERVREALFSVLQSRLGSVGGLAFLDLYAGSGAVGLEAASRGATPVTLVERDRAAAAVAEQNVAAVGLGGTVVRAPVARFVARPPAGTAYDVVFLDPPYDLPAGEVRSVLNSLLAHGWLAGGALVVVERSTRTAELAWPDGLVEVDRRRYGETALLVAERAPDAPGHDGP